MEVSAATTPDAGAVGGVSFSQPDACDDSAGWRRATLVWWGKETQNTSLAPIIAIITASAGRRQPLPATRRVIAQPDARQRAHQHGANRP